MSETDDKVKNKTNFLFGNIRGLYLKTNKTKMDTLSNLASINEANDILMMVSHLNDEIKDSEIRIDNNSIQRSDRNGRSHGGVVIFSHNYINGVKISEWQD